MRFRSEFLLTLACLSSADSWRARSTRGGRLCAARQSLLEKLLGDPSAVSTATQVEVCAAPSSFSAFKEAAFAWSQSAKGQGWTVQLQEHVPDDPVARPLYGEVTGYLLGFAVQPLRLRFVAQETSEALEAELKAFLREFEAERRGRTARDSGAAVFEVPPTANEYKVLLLGSRGEDGRPHRLLSSFSKAEGEAELAAEPMAKAESEEASTYENLHVANYNPTALTKERTVGQLDLFRKDLPAAKAAVEDVDLQMRRKHCFGEGKVTLAQIFQFDWTRPQAVLAGTESALEHAAELIKSSEGTSRASPRSVEVLVSAQSPSLLKLSCEFDGLQELLRYLVTDQEDILERLAEHRAEVSPVRQVLRNLDEASEHSPAARHIYSGRRSALPGCFLDCLSEEGLGGKALIDLVCAAVDFGMRGLCLTGAQLEQIDLAALKAGAPSLHAAVALKLEAPSFEEDLARARGQSSLLGSVLISVDPLSGDVDRLASVLGQLEKEDNDSSPLRGVHMQVLDENAEAAAAQKLKDISKMTTVEVLACERSVLRPQFVMDEALRDVGLDGLAWLNLDCDSDEALLSNRVLKAILSKQPTLTLRQVLAKWHGYQGDIACFRPTLVERAGGEWEDVCIQFAKEVTEASVLDLKPEYVAALSAMRSS